MEGKLPRCCKESFPSVFKANLEESSNSLWEKLFLWVFQSSFADPSIWYTSEKLWLSIKAFEFLSEANSDSEPLERILPCSSLTGTNEQGENSSGAVNMKVWILPFSSSLEIIIFFIWLLINNHAWVRKTASFLWTSLFPMVCSVGTELHWCIRQFMTTLVVLPLQKMCWQETLQVSFQKVTFQGKLQYGNWLGGNQRSSPVHCLWGCLVFLAETEEVILSMKRSFTLWIHKKLMVIRNYILWETIQLNMLEVHVFHCFLNFKQEKNADWFSSE